VDSKGACMMATASYGGREVLRDRCPRAPLRVGRRLTAGLTSDAALSSSWCHSSEDLTGGATGGFLGRSPPTGMDDRAAGRRTA
jgi:hypothetical protein